MDNPFTEFATPDIPTVSPQQLVDSGPKKPAVPAVNPFSQFAQSEQANPFIEFARPEDNTRLSSRVLGMEAGQAVQPGFSERHPILSFFIRAAQEQMRDASNALVYTLTGTVSGEPEPVRILGSTVGIGDVATTRATELTPPALQDENMNSVLRGTALIASFIGPAVLAKVPGAAKLLGKAGSFLTAEFLGGATYGAIKPLSPDESRTQAVAQEAVLFAAFSGVLAGSVHATASGFRRYILAMPRAKRIAAIAFARQRLADEMDRFAADGGSLSAMEPEQQAAVVEQVYSEAIQHVEPAAIDLEGIARASADRSIEPAPRMDEAPTAIETTPSPSERDLELPDLPLSQSLQVSRPLSVPPKTEPAVKPAGFIEGAGTPEALQIQPVSPHTMHVLPDGSLEVVGYRGVAAGRDPLHPGVGETTFMADDPYTASSYRSTAKGTHPDEVVSPENTISRIRVTFKKPYIIDDFLDLQMGPHDAARYRVLSDKTLEGTITPAESAEADDLLKRSLSVAESADRLRAAGYDGIVVREGMQGMEIIALNQKIAKTEATIAGAAVEVPGMRPSLVFLHFADVLSSIRKGIAPAEAIALGARDTANKIGKPDLVQALEQAYTKIASFMGDDLLPRAQHMAIDIRGENSQMRQILRALEQQSAANRLQRTAADAIEQAAIEPHEVNAPQAPPAGFEPTQVGATPADQLASVREMALGDAVVRDATARIDPIAVSSPEVRSDAALLLDAIDDPGKASLTSTEETRTVMDDALRREEPAATQGALLDLTKPQPWEINIDRKVPRREAEFVKRELNKALKREHPPIEVDPIEQSRAPWMEVPGESPSVPVEQDALNVLAKFKDDQLEALGNGLDRLAKEGGFVHARLMTGIVGAGFEVLGMNDELSPGWRNTFRAVGGIFLLASLNPALEAWVKKYMRGFLLNANPTALMTHSGAKEAFRQLIEVGTQARTLATEHMQMLRKVFEPGNYRAAMLVLDEMDPAKGYFPPEWNLFTPSQQSMLMGLNQFNLRLGQVLKREGVLDQYIENYVRHRLPPETFQRWRVTGFRNFYVGGNIAQRRHILKLRDLEAWAQAQGVPGPVLDLPAVHAGHVQEAYRAIGNVRLRKALEVQGLIQDAPKNAFQVLPAGIRQIRIAGMGNKVAPEEVAKALENLAEPRTSDSDIVNSLDVVKSYWMRSVMFWFWEHGFNAMRAIPLISMNPAAALDAWQMVKRMDPAMMEAAKHGANFFNRPDIVAQMPQWFERLLNNSGWLGATTRAIHDKGGWLIERQDRLLWNQIIPSMQLFAYQTQMRNWASQTGGKFLPGTPEYIAAARKAADFSNTVAGKMPTELANPRLTQFMRLVLFSPQWTTSRIALTVHAAGELGEIAAGRLNPLHAAYLPMKLRQVALLTTLTWLGSKVMTGEEPEFNPNTHKFYMKTGLRGVSGRQVGLDLWGWWQDDLKAFGNPAEFLSGRLNPVLKLAGETISGRDYLGRDMTGAQSLSNIMRSFGPPAEAAELIARLIQGANPGGAPGMQGGEVMQRVFGVLATANTATLQRPVDAVIGRYAERLLKNQGVPATDDNIFELSRLLRSNLLAGHSMIDNRVVTYLGYRRRSSATRDPLGTSGGQLWEYARHAIADF